MSYDEFKENFFKTLENLLPEGFTPEIRSVKKNNNVVLDGIAVYKKDADIKISPVVYLNNLYADFQHFHGGMEDFAKNVRDEYFMRNLEINTDFIHEFQPERLFIRVVNAERNKNIMMECPYQKEGDFLLTYRMWAFHDENGIASFIVTNQMMKQYGITKEQLHNMAMLNTQKEFPLRFETMTNRIFGIATGIESHGNFMIDVKPEDKMEPHVLTNQENMNGATVLFYPEVKEALSRQFEEGYYVIPSSIHEVLILSADTVNGKKDEKFLTEMIRGVNKSDVMPDEILSENLYRVDSDCKLRKVSLEQERVKKPHRRNDR